MKKLIKDSKGRLVVHADVDGDWLSHLKIGNPKSSDSTVWEFDQLKAYKIHYVSNPLPSDCRFRVDLIALLNEDLRKA